MSSIFDVMAAIFVQVLGDDEAVAYTHAGSTVLFRGIFEDPATLADTGDGPPAVSRAPRLHCAGADLPGGYGQGDTVRIALKNYAVRAALDDGRGMVVLELERMT